MPAKNIAVRIGLEGGADVKRAMEETGRAGQEAFRNVGAAADQAGAATDRLTQKVRQTGAAAASMPAGGTSGGTMPTPSPTVQREIERVRRQVDDEYRKAQQFGRADQAIGSGARYGYFDEAEAERLRRLAAAKYGQDNDPNRRGLSSFQKRDLTYQGLDVFTGVAGGMPLSMIAAQQGPQIFQGLATGEGGLKAGLSALATSAASLVTPFTVAAAAATGLGAAYGLAAKAASDDRKVLENATQGIGRGTGATVSQLDAVAQANAAAGKVSVSAAREIAAGYASTGQIAIPVIGELTRVTSEYARLTAQDVPSATQQLAASFADPARGADELAQRIGGLDDRTKALIQTQVEQGDRSAAQQTLADALKLTIDANASATTGWAAAWNTATTAANGYWEAAKRIAGIKLGVAPEGAAEAVKRLQEQVDYQNTLRTRAGLPTMSGFDSKNVRDLEAAKVIADTEAREARAKAAEEAANRASVRAGELGRTLDPQAAQLRDLTTKRNELQTALDNPLARAKLSDPDEVQRAAESYNRAIATMTDSSGKLITSGERLRQQDQLRLDALKAKTLEEKAAVAERQKAYDLAGKPMSALDAGASISRAGILAQAQEQSKGGGGGSGSDTDDYTRSVRSIEDRIRRQGEEAETYGMTADVVARYRTEQELLTAAKRADRDITPELTAQIRDYADRAADAAKRNEDLRDSLKNTDNIRSVGGDGVRSLVQDLGKGTNAAHTLENALSRIKQRVLDLAADSITDSLFGKRGTSGGLMDTLVAGAKSLFSMGAADGYVPRFATGSASISEAGIVSGPGTSTSDSIIARLSTREAVIRASSVEHYGADFIRSINDRTFGSRAPGYAGGYPSGDGGEPALFVRAS